MAYTIVLHLQNEEAVEGEVDEIPSPSDSLLVFNHPRRVDGKALHYLSDDVVTVIWPVSRINFVEIMPLKDAEEITFFVRE